MKSQLLGVGPRHQEFWKLSGGSRVRTGLGAPVLGNIFREEGRTCVAEAKCTWSSVDTGRAPGMSWVLS